MYRTPDMEESLSKTRTMEVHQGEKGWYYTIHQDDTLTYTSKEFFDRSIVAREGLKYLDFLNTCDYEARQQKKGKPNGHD